MLDEGLEQSFSEPMTTQGLLYSSWVWRLWISGLL
jgi:hypothetical protein